MGKRTITVSSIRKETRRRRDIVPRCVASYFLRLLMRRRIDDARLGTLLLPSASASASTIRVSSTRKLIRITLERGKTAARCGIIGTGVRNDVGGSSFYLVVVSSH